MRTRHDYDDKYLYSRSYSGSRADYDDKFLLQSYGTCVAGIAYDDQYARGVVVCCEGEVSYFACLLWFACMLGLFEYLVACVLSYLVG